MENINIHKAKTQLSELLARIEKDKVTIRICRSGKPIADLVPIEASLSPLVQKKDLKKIKILYDPTQPLTEEEWGVEYK